MSKIGVFGGSFNPIHVGHALIASYIVDSGAVDQLWLMVAPQNPLKEGVVMAGDAHRLRMAEMVTRRLPRVETTAFEFELPRPSYTVNTLNALQAKFPHDEFYLVIGADNWCNFDQWKDGETIIKNHHVLVYPRRGFEVVIPKEFESRVAMVDAPLVELSSTVVRQRLKAMKSVSFYVPDDVEKYILKNKLYIQ